MVPTWANPRDSLHQEIAALRVELADAHERVHQLKRMIQDTDTDYSLRWRLTRFEATILSYLMSGRVFSDEQLQELCLDCSRGVASRNISVILVRLRKKLGQDGIVIETLYNQGYVMRREAIARVKVLCSITAKAA